jgi:predicted TIM-barrel fold metal-dependent hydrolase
MRQRFSQEVGTMALSTGAGSSRSARAALSTLVLLSLAMVSCAPKRPPDDPSLDARGLEVGSAKLAQRIEQVRSRAPENVDDLVIDVHAHVFNAWDLPLGDFLRTTKPMMTPVAGLIVKALRTGAPRYRGQGGSSCLSDRREPASSAELCTEEEAEELFRLILEQDQDLLQLVDEQQERGAFDWAAAGPRLVRFVSAFYRSRTKLALILAETYGEIDLFTPSMVDMDGWAGQDAKLLTVEDRLIAMGNAMLAINGAQPGLIHPFVSFNPRHGIEGYPEYVENYHQLLERALTQDGFLGVKLYPAFGYFPIDNVTADTAGLERPEFAAQVDAELEWLYDFAERNDIPIMAHCTATGAELGKRHAEVFGHPSNWRPVLERYPNLRLSLGHFGKVSTLLADDDPESNWPVIIADMMESYPHLYGDLAYDGIANELQFRLMLDELKKLMDSKPILRERLMYGTDWFQILISKGSKVYYDKWNQGFTVEEFGSDTRRRFFGGNAASFLGLDDERTLRRLRHYYRARELVEPAWLGEASPSPQVPAAAVDG